MYYSERKRLKEIADREAKGESIWSSHVPKPLRYKLLNVITTAVKILNNGRHHTGQVDLLKAAQLLLTADLGKPYLSNRYADPSNDMQTY